MCMLCRSLWSWSCLTICKHRSCLYTWFWFQLCCFIRNCFWTYSLHKLRLSGWWILPVNHITGCAWYLLPFQGCRCCLYTLYTDSLNLTRLCYSRCNRLCCCLDRKCRRSASNIITLTCNRNSCRSKKSKTCVVSWKKTKGADGYEVYMSYTLWLWNNRSYPSLISFW